MSDQSKRGNLFAKLVLIFLFASCNNDVLGLHGDSNETATYYLFDTVLLAFLSDKMLFISFQVGGMV